MTIDTALNQLYPVNQIGSDGFNWWIGQIEERSKEDPKGSGRCKVRIVGLHPQSCDIVSNEDLPWAQVMMPVTNPHIPGACVSVSDQLYQGVWVVGFFLDNDKQQPMIMGSIGLVAKATEQELPAQDMSDKCRSFTTFIDNNKNAADQGSENEASVDQQDAGHVSDGKEREGCIISSSITNLQDAHRDQNTDGNPGRKVCVMKADKCGKESDMKGTMSTLIGEMLHEVQRNNGKIGSYLVSPLSGQLTDIMDIGRDYTDKIVTIIRTFIAKVKGFVVAKIKEGVQALTTALLRPTKGGNALTGLTSMFNEQLAKLGCSMADLGDRLAAWIEDIIFGYLFNLYKATACQVDKFVSGLLNKIQSLMTGLLDNILGPLQSVLGAIASPLNMIGDAINYVLNLLGISCDGPPKGCDKTVKVCSDKKISERESFLDKLLEDIEAWPGGEDWNQYTCDDAYEGTKLDDTEVSFVGGIQNTVEEQRYIYYDLSDNHTVNEGEQVTLTITRYGVTDVASSVKYTTLDGSATGDVDYQKVSGVIGFSIGETEKQITIRSYVDQEVDGYEDFFLRIIADSPADGSIYQSRFANNIARIVIKEIKVGGGETEIPTDDTQVSIDTTDNPVFPSINITAENRFVDTDPSANTYDAPENTEPRYTITPDKTSVKEGEFITYTIKADNVPFGTNISYRLFGTNITPSDIVGNNLSGQMTIEDYDDDYNAKVVVGINKDTSIEETEMLSFSIPGTGSVANVIILSDTSDLSQEEKDRINDKSTDKDTPYPVNKIPTVGPIITGPGGEIVSIPIDNTGNSYDEPPHVFITGQGWGAQGQALLDSNGYVTEIRVVEPGVGYKLNTSDIAKKECIIDSFTMITPGREFKSTPKVWIDGDDSIAEAVINSNGQVVSVRVKNREMTFSSYPEVIINGGGGYGAKFIPSFACLDPDVRVKIGSAKVGTGSYIDCP